MADNIDVSPGTGKTIAADEIAGALHQRVKITIGADGTDDGDVSSVNPMPVTVSSGTVTVSGTVAVTGSTSVINTVTVTGSTSVINTVVITGSTSIINVAQKSGRFNYSLTSGSVVTASTVAVAVSNATTYITGYMISVATAGNYWLENGAGTALTPYHILAANGGVSFSVDPSTPISSAITNTTIALKGSVAGSCGCLVIGYTA